MKKIRLVVYVLLFILGIYVAFSFFKSNEEYVADAQDAYKEILKPGIYKGNIKKYFDQKDAIYSETKKENCRPWSKGDFEYKCEYSSSMHTRLSVGSFMNPVRSGAHYHLFFDSKESLVTYKILISHSFF